MTSRWLRLIRIHTASLTQPIVLLGLFVAGVEDWKLYLFFAAFAVIYHAAGFVQNDICDYAQDSQDTAKKHFPLISGEISLKQAKYLYYVLVSATIIIGILLSNGRALSLLFLIISVGFGYIYNIRSKKDVFSPLYIAGAFIALPLFSYYSHVTELSNVIVALVLYLVFLMLYQIGIEGYMKDFTSDNVSLLGRLGTVYTKDGRVNVNTTTKWFAWFLKVPTFLLFYIIGWICQSDVFSMALGTILMLCNILASWKLLESGPYNNHKRVRLCSIIEVVTYSQLIFALQGMLGWHGVAVFILYPYFWFFVLNRLTWKTWITPRV